LFALPIGLRWATYGAMAWILAGSLWELASPQEVTLQWAAVRLAAELETSVPGDWPLWLRALAIGASTAPLLYALWRLAALLRLAAHGAVFSAPAAAHLRSFGLWLLIATLVESFFPGLLQLVRYAVSDLAGTFKLTWTLASSDIWNVFLSALFMLVARVLSDGYRLAEENRQFI
jgi:hypothetical protein